MHSTFYAWSQEHIKRVFEAKSARDCLRALDDTFSQTIDLSLNGQSLPRTHLQTAIMAMVESSGFRLSVEWFSGSECARDMSNRVRSHLAPKWEMRSDVVLAHRTGPLKGTMSSATSESSSLGARHLCCSNDTRGSALCKTISPAAGNRV